ncbi:secreted protein [Candidatus Magnetobacterium bavaricum]|uniref:Secreted protein n=1 Tax=Candidatus Magnetobacterium bavaricum TaxID=29290 RepID=A0A0F3GUQ5_9BACT|nr:secreted protein [Candidatus Magnetobacterium bavaricum]
MLSAIVNLLGSVAICSLFISLLCTTNNPPLISLVTLTADEVSIVNPPCTFVATL